MRIRKNLYVVDGPNANTLRILSKCDPAYEMLVQPLRETDPNNPNATPTDPEKVEELTREDVEKAAELMGMGEPAGAPVVAPGAVGEPMELEGMSPAGGPDDDEAAPLVATETEGDEDGPRLGYPDEAEEAPE